MSSRPPTYEEFRTGLTFKDVRRILADEQVAAAANGDRMYVRRNGVLGRFREIKLQMYDYVMRHGLWREDGTER